MFGEPQIALLRRFQPEFHFKHTETFIKVVEKNLADFDCISHVMTKATNPLMLFVLTQDLLQKLRIQFNSLSLRIMDLENEILDNMVAIFEKIFVPDQVEALLK